MKSAEYDKIKPGQLYRALATRNRLGFRPPWWRQGDIVFIVSIEYDAMAQWAQRQGHLSMLMPDGTCTVPAPFNEADFFLQFERVRPT